MGSLCQCLARFCCDDPYHERNEDQSSSEGGIVEATARMNRETPTVPNESEQSCCAHTQGIHDLLRRLRDRFQPSVIDQRYAIMPQYDDEEDAVKKSPRQAVSFRSTREIPCIASDEIVLPGSKLQQEMAEKLVSARLTDDDVECVICMEPFDDTNPRMPTLCGCGENKTYFHLPCLYQWLDQSTECPSCRTKLSWEEF